MESDPASDTLRGANTERDSIYDKYLIMEMETVYRDLR